MVDPLRPSPSRPDSRVPGPHEQLDRRCALFAWAAMAAAAAFGLLAWGPIRLALPATAPMHASWPAVLVELVALCLPLLAASAWGWQALSRTDWPAAVRRPWRWQFAWLAIGALPSAVHLIAPHELWRLLGHGAAVGAVLLLGCGLLAERVHAAWGSLPTCAAASTGSLLAVGLGWLSASGGQPLDLRPLCLLALLPLLLVPAGATRLAGRCTRPHDAMAMLALHAAAWALSPGSAWLSPGLDGTLGIQVLAHLSLAAAAGLLAYRAVDAAATPAPATSAPERTQASTSFST